MPAKRKRRHSDDESAYLSWKIRKLERKLERRRSRRGRDREQGQRDFNPQDLDMDTHTSPRRSRDRDEIYRDEGDNTSGIKVQITNLSCDSGQFLGLTRRKNIAIRAAFGAASRHTHT